MGGRPRRGPAVAPPTREERLTVSRLFVYGTLKDDAVVQQLLGGRLFARPGVLKGYRRTVDPAIGYPVIHPHAGETVPGKLLDGVDAAILAVLDAYEGAEYRRIIVPVQTVDGRTVDAYVYVPAGS
jgi:gamma-glutamylcyclotransferase (GGCT)/AIG2-like uncharacterized protein YtfP